MSSCRETEILLRYSTIFKYSSKWPHTDKSC